MGFNVWVAQTYDPELCATDIFLGETSESSLVQCFMIFQLTVWPWIPLEGESEQ